MGGYYLQCTGDYLYGDLTGEYLFMSHNWIARVKKTMVTGYTDSDGTIPSGEMFMSFHKTV